MFPITLKNKTCDKAVIDDTSSLQFIPGWFVTQQQIDLWYDDECQYYDDELIKWYKGYQKRKDQKAKIKKELLPIAWHPFYPLLGIGMMDWCTSEDKKWQQK